MKQFLPFLPPSHPLASNIRRDSRHLSMEVAGSPGLSIQDRKEHHPELFKVTDWTRVLFGRRVGLR